jgi:steroid 5-alpha reductase family enzyme
MQAVVLLHPVPSVLLELTTLTRDASTVPLVLRELTRALLDKLLVRIVLLEHMLWLVKVAVRFVPLVDTRWPNGVVAVDVQRANIILVLVTVLVRCVLLAQLHVLEKEKLVALSVQLVA